MLVPGKIGERFDSGGVGNIAREGQRLDPERAQRIHRLAQPVRARLEQDDPRTRRADPLRQRKTDPRRPTGDDDALALKVHGPSPSLQG